MEYNTTAEFNSQEDDMKRETQMDDPEMMPYDTQHGYGYGIMPSGTKQTYGESTLPHVDKQMNGHDTMPYGHQQMYGQGTMPYGYQQMYGQGTSSYWMQGMNNYPWMQSYPMMYGQQMAHEDMHSQTQNPQSMYRQGNILPLLPLGSGAYGFDSGFSPYYPPYYPPYFSPYHGGYHLRNDE